MLQDSIRIASRAGRWEVGGRKPVMRGRLAHPPGVRYTPNSPTEDGPMRIPLHGLALVAGGLTGCASFDARDPFAALNPFGSERRFDPNAAPVANTQAATRADAVASAVIAQCRTELPDKPLIMTIGVNDAMIFHERAGRLVLSDGAVERGRTDDELAAELCHERGKMAVEQAEKGAVRGDSDAPPAPRLAADVVGGGYSPDMTRLAEEAKFSRRAPRSPREPRPDPRTLALNFYSRSGHNTDDFARVESLLREAEDNADRRDVMRRR